MIQKALRMKIYPGCGEEYTKRHNQLWPEMRKMLEEHGAINYQIFLDPETDYLFAFLTIEDEAKWAQTADTAINRKWWVFMADIMETNPDQSPVAVDLVKVFEL